MLPQNIPIPEQLKAHVACIRIVERTRTDSAALTVCLNGLPGIVFQHHNGRSSVEKITTSSGCATGIPTLYVYGQMTQPGVMHHKPEPFTTTQIVLKPHALQTLLGINAAVLTNGMVDLGEFSAVDLNTRLMEATNDQERLTLLTDYLTAKLQQASPRDRLIEESLRLIHQKIGYITVKDLLETLSLSERQFERRFGQTVGLSPQFYIRVKRFNAALHLMQSGRFTRLTDVAHALHFYDQSHFIRDIKAFSGITPKSLFQKMEDLRSDQTVYAYP